MRFQFKKGKKEGSVTTEYKNYYSTFNNMKNL